MAASRKGSGIEAGVIGLAVLTPLIFADKSLKQNSLMRSHGIGTVYEPTCAHSHLIGASRLTSLRRALGRGVHCPAEVHQLPFKGEGVLGTNGAVSIDVLRRD